MVATLISMDSTISMGRKRAPVDNHYKRLKVP